VIRSGLALATGLALVAISAGGAVAAPGSDDLCIQIPLVSTCSTGSGGSGGDGGSGGVVGGVVGGVTGLVGGVAPTLPVAGPTPSWGPVVEDDANTFTLPAAQLGGSSLSISGLHSLGLARVPLTGGGHAVVIKLVADRVSMNGFLLDVKGHAGGTSLVTDDTNMTLTGHVSVYLDSLTATLPGGIGLSLLANTPPPGDELPPTLLRVNLGLVGVTADSIVHTGTHQEIHPGS